MEAGRFIARGVLIFGASGSGTTTLGIELARVLNYAHFDADDYYWQESEIPYTNKRPVEERISMLLDAIHQSRGFVLSGSICGWDDPLLPFFDLAIFLTVPTETRMRRLKQRELEHYGSRILEGGELYGHHQWFMKWASAYDTAGTEQRSRALHEEWVKKLDCPVLRVDGTQDATLTARRIADWYCLNA